jgi:hypothetical protein
MTAIRQACRQSRAQKPMIVSHLSLSSYNVPVEPHALLTREARSARFQGLREDYSTFPLCTKLQAPSWGAAAQSESIRALAPCAPNTARRQIGTEPYIAARSDISSMSDSSKHTRFGLSQPPPIRVPSHSHKNRYLVRERTSTRNTYAETMAMISWHHLVVHRNTPHFSSLSRTRFLPPRPIVPANLARSPRSTSPLPRLSPERGL